MTSQARTSTSQPAAVPNSTSRSHKETLMFNMLRGKFEALLRQLCTSELPANTKTEINRLLESQFGQLKSLRTRDSLALLNCIHTPFDALAYLVTKDMDSNLWDEIYVLRHTYPNIWFEPLANILKTGFKWYAMVPHEGSDSSMGANPLPTVVSEALDLVGQAEDGQEGTAKDPSLKDIPPKLEAITKRLIEEMVISEAALEEWNDADSGSESDSSHAARLSRKCTT